MEAQQRKGYGLSFDEARKLQLNCTLGILDPKIHSNPAKAAFHSLPTSVYLEHQIGRDS
jgi:hypothetical protein